MEGGRGLAAVRANYQSAVISPSRPHVKSPRPAGTTEGGQPAPCLDTFSQKNNFCLLDNRRPPRLPIFQHNHRQYGHPRPRLHEAFIGRRWAQRLVVRFQGRGAGSTVFQEISPVLPLLHHRDRHPDCGHRAGLQILDHRPLKGSTSSKAILLISVKSAEAAFLNCIHPSPALFRALPYLQRPFPSAHTAPPARNPSPD